MRGGPVRMIRVVLLLVLVASVGATSRNCSSLKGRQLRRCLAATRRNEGVELDVDDAYEECEGSANIEDCVVEYNLVHTFLAQHNLDSVPEECAGKDSITIEACLAGWEIKQIILGISNTEALTSQPITSPSQSLDHGSSLTEPLMGTKEVGPYLMSLTTYSRTSRERTITTEEGILTREHELAAARQHLRERYEDVFHLPVVAVDLQFLPDGVTELSESKTFDTSMIQHSTFFGNVTFVEESSRSLPTTAQLELVTLESFSGESKEEFIKKYHFHATGSSSYFGVKYRYDVSVRKLNKNDASNIAAASQEMQGIQETYDKTDVPIGTSRMFIGIMTMFAFVILGTLIGLAVLVRKRQLDRVHSEQSLHDGSIMVEEVDVIGSQVGSDVSLSPLELLEADSHLSNENISHLDIDLSPLDIDEDEEHMNVPENRSDDSKWNDDSKKDIPYIDVELEISSHCKELLTDETT